jgi:hypothetical protein
MRSGFLFGKSIGSSAQEIGLEGELRNVREFRGGSALLFRTEHSHGPKTGAGEVVATQVPLEIERAIRNIVVDIPGGEDAHT